MKQRLTVHLKDVPQTTIQVEYKGEDGKKVVKDKKILVNTLSYEFEKPSDVEAILREQTYEVKKYYTSNIN